jgi:DNA-directed RNA polymerase specialized sigma24 family protein
MNDRSTRDLAEAWREGDQEAAAQLHEQLQPAARRYAQRKSSSRSLKSELSGVLNSAFAQFFHWTRTKPANPINDTRHAGNLLKRIIQRGILRRAAKPVPGTTDAAAFVDRRITPEQHAASLDEIDFLLREFSSLVPEIVHLRMEGRSSAEIADKTKCSRQHVRIVLNRFAERVQNRMRRLIDSRS